MNTAAIGKLRDTLARGRVAHGLWVTLEAPSITEMAVALGLDWVVIDAEHGHLDWGQIAAHLRAAVRSRTVALVRIAELDRGLVKRVLDIGADGVVIPWIETAEQLRRAVAYARFPPEGCRGIGAERATAWGEAMVEHTAEANEHVLVVPTVETTTAEANLDALCAVEGVDTFFFGPADFSASAGHRGHWQGPGVAERLLAMNATIRRAGKSCGVVASSVANLAERAEQGFGMIALGLDCGLLLRSLHEALAAAGRDRKIRANLHAEEPLT
jgi:2-dehydro-3-deoxyglucarate aldolase/4-hydroxy-2-oxoheptanedioate aldolase